MKELMVWDVIMYTEDEDGTITKYQYGGDCSFICDYITIDECDKIEENK